MRLTDLKSVKLIDHEIRIGNNMGFTPAEIEERVLEAEIVKNPETIEKGLVIVDHQVPAGAGKMDILAIDSGNVIAIIELKVNEDDGMFMQALEYYDWVSQNLDRLAERYQEKNPKLKIDSEEAPRVILIAPTFSPSLKTCCKYVSLTVDLFEYTYLKSKSGEKGLVCKSVEIEPPSGPPSKPPEIADVVNHITDTKMRQFCKEIMNKIQKVGKDIEVKPSKWSLSFKYANRAIAYIVTRRNYFYVNYPYRGRWYWNPIEKKRDFSSDIMVKIRDFYDKLKRE